jgi:hypothetical protein
MIQRSDLIKWLNKCVFKGKGGEGVRMWALRHVDSDERTQAVDEWPYKQGQDTADLADEMINAATRDAIGLEGVEKYVVEAYFGTSKTRGLRYTATIDGGGKNRDEDGMDGGFHTEPSGKRGDAMQGRRHIENLHRLSVGSANETMRILRAENEHLRAQNEKLMEKHYKIIDTYETLADKTHARNIEIRKIEMEEGIKKQLFDAVAPMIPSVGMKLLTGKDPTPPGGVSVPEQQLFKSLSKYIIDNQETVMPALLQAFGNAPGLLAGIKDLVDKYGVEEPEAPESPPVTNGSYR